MKREIKFRAWDEKQNYLAYQGTPDLESLENFMHHFSNKRLMQYTGCDDMNKKQIFEGDFLKCTNKESMFYEETQDELSSYYLVMWDNQKNGWNSFPVSILDDEQFNIAIKQLGGLITWPNENILNNSWHYEIIGNLYENPEMALRLV